MKYKNTIIIFAASIFLVAVLAIGLIINNNIKERNGKQLTQEAQTVSETNVPEVPVETEAPYETQLPETTEPQTEDPISETEEPTPEITATPEVTEMPTDASTTAPPQAQAEKPSTPPSTTPPTSHTAKPTTKPTAYAPEAATYTGNFTRDLEKFLKSNGYKNENYVVSPTSYRAALCLAIAGANRDTKERLIKAAGFKSQNDANSWYNNLLNSIADFNRLTENNNSDGFMKESYDVGYEIANAIWNNKDRIDNFKSAYIDYVKLHYGAEADSLPGNDLQDAINSWCEEKTHGLIKGIVGPEIANCASVLANALYIKDAWREEFIPDGEKTFHTISGSDVMKSFITNTDKYRYYEDEKTKLVVIPMYGNKEFVLVIGDTNNVLNKAQSAETHLVKITMPKMDIESTYNSKELVNFIVKRGAGDAVDPDHADFSELYDEAGTWFIGDVIQKAKIKTDENGLEAAAVTVIIMVEGAAPGEPEEPIEFTADVPFSFYVVDTYNSINEILFFGQMVK